jgi:hypothetical protein
MVVEELRYQSVPEAELYTPLRQLAAEFDDVVAGSYPQTELRRIIVRLRGGDAERVGAAARRMIELDPRGELLSAPLHGRGEAG